MGGESTARHVHSVGVGFVMFVILGVAQWLFPRAPKDDHRYRPERLLASYWILTLSTALRVGSEVARASSDAYALRMTVVAAGMGQILGLVVYFYSMWSRIRPVGVRHSGTGGRAILTPRTSSNPRVGSHVPS